MDSNFTYVLRTCNEDMTSGNGFIQPPFFVWPESGPVEAPDWDPDPVRSCGGGLHGLEYGQGDLKFCSIYRDMETAKWMVVKVDKSAGFVPSKDKVRFRRGEVIYAGDRPGALKKFREVGFTGALPWDLVLVGDKGTATAGWNGTATAGWKGTATAGWNGTATAGDYGTATAGDYGTATAGNYGTATAGKKGIISLRWYDQAAERYRLTILYPGENDIKENTKYRLDELGNPVEVTE